jgi:hypothetical protein
MREGVFAFLAVVVTFISSARAYIYPVVNSYLTTINATATGGTWQVYADDSHDNDGLAGWSIDVIGAGGAVANTAATIKAPRPFDVSGQYSDGLGGNLGFNTFVYSGAANGTSRIGITAQQDTAYGPDDDPTFDMGVLVGVGQEPSSASQQNGTQGPWDGSGTPTGIATPVWNYTPFTTVSGGVGAPSYQIAGTLIEQGTYTTSNRQGTLTVSEEDLVLTLGTLDNGMNEPWDRFHQSGYLPDAIVTPDTIPLSVPEPASLSLLGISLGVINLFARRTRRQPQFTSNSMD